eukprot:g17006.t1
MNANLSQELFSTADACNPKIVHSSPLAWSTCYDLLQKPSLDAWQAGWLDPFATAFTPRANSELILILAVPPGSSGSSCLHEGAGLG